ncbi:MAG TPA: peroxide stress protein YaaA [Crocinitomicaceae bacterium]|nr:peroxide stress protein YaaA [Crocinitomicaceae bacterium]
MKVILSPAKKIDTTKGLNTAEYSIPAFIDEADYLIKKLKKKSSKSIGEMMHLSKDLSDLNYQRYQDWKPDFKPSKNTCYVSSAFDGEVYRGLDASSFTAKEIIIAQEKIRILSGLYGILKPLDLIHPYRLEMGTRWAVTPSKSNLYKFWGAKIATAINEENKEGIIINLASTEYFKAVDKKVLKGRVITPSFKELKNGEYKVVMVYAKKARGLMARYIVKNNISNPEDLKLFDIDGYQLDANLSDGDNWVFTR